MAFKMGLKVGDTITLTSARGEATAFGTLPTRRAYRIAGIFDVGMHEYDSSFIFMPFDVAESCLACMTAPRGWKSIRPIRRTSL